MKVRDLFERRLGGSSSTPVKFVWTLEWQDEAGEWQSDDVTVTGSVSYDSDPYNTGDSPESYEFSPKAVISGNTKQPIDINSIPQEEWDKIEQYAFEQARDDLEGQEQDHADYLRDQQRYDRF